MKAPQKSLNKWTKEKWGTKSGKPSTQGKKKLLVKGTYLKQLEMPYRVKSMQQHLLLSVKVKRLVNSSLNNQKR